MLLHALEIPKSKGMAGEWGEKLGERRWIGNEEGNECLVRR